MNKELVFIAEKLLEREEWLATAESCTGGGIGQVLTSLAGSSQWYLGGVVSYSNQLKRDYLQVSSESLDEFGAVSEQVAAEMAFGAVNSTGADYSVATTGIAGPDGGSVEKPVGTVCFGFYIREELITETEYFSGNREQIRLAATKYALVSLAEKLI